MKAISFFRLCVIVIIVVFFASCSKTNKQGRYVPKDAAFVLVADGKSLSSKLSWDEIKKDTLFQKLFAESTTSSTLKSILNNPDSSGVDTKSDLIFFIEKDSTGGYLGLEGTIKDANLFKSFNEQLSNGGTESDLGDASYISRYPSCIGWNKERFVYLFDVPEFGKLGSFSPMTDNGFDQRSGRDIDTTCKAVFALEEGSSLAKNDKFTKLMKETGDIYFWANTESFYKGSSMPMLSMMNLDEFYKENISTGVLNFGNGKISLTMKNYLNDKIFDLYKKYKGDKINEDMLKRIPGKDIQGVMAFNINPEFIKELLKETNTDGLVNMGLSSLKLSVTDFVNAFKGDFVLGLSDFKLNTDSVNYPMGEGKSFKMTKEKPAFNFIFAATIDDKDALNKIIDAHKKFSHEEEDDSTSKDHFADATNATYYVVSNNKENTEKFLNGNTGANVDFINKINGEPVGFYLNIHSLLKNSNDFGTKDSSAMAAYNASLNFWDNISVKGGAIDDGTIIYSMDVNLMDTATNSLKQLHQYFATMAETVKEKKAQQRAEREKIFSEMNAGKGFLPPPIKDKH